jgi:hypothetical protein
MDRVANEDRISAEVSPDQMRHAVTMKPDHPGSEMIGETTKVSLQKRISALPRVSNVDQELQLTRQVSLTTAAEAANNRRSICTG